jgi:hypothetical protein
MISGIQKILIECFMIQKKNKRGLGIKRQPHDEINYETNI